VSRRFIATLAVALVAVVVPVGVGHDAAAAPTQAAKPVVLGLSYKVVPGDSFARIARRHGVRLADLLRANRARATTVLRPGRVLRIPNITIPAGLAAKLPRTVLRRPERLRLVPLFAGAAREFGVPADLVMAVGYRESNWNGRALSRSGAIGVGQLMPSTVTFVSQRLLRLPKALDPWDPSENIRMSARILRHLLDLTRGDVFRALVAYYQGFGSLTRLGVLPIGQRYANSVLALRPQFRA
jgi:soluble lytic murein transglycosylase-like protein